MKRWSKAKRIGWWFFVAWTLLVTVRVGWGMPMLSFPSAGQIMLLLELTALCFIVAFGISAVIEAWMQMLRRHR